MAANTKPKVLPAVLSVTPVNVEPRQREGTVWPVAGATCFCHWDDFHAVIVFFNYWLIAQLSLLMMIWSQMFGVVVIGACAVAAADAVAGIGVAIDVVTINCPSPRDRGNCPDTLCSG